MEAIRSFASVTGEVLEGQPSPLGGVPFGQFLPRVALGSDFRTFATFLRPPATVANNMAVPEGLTLLRGGGRYLNIGAGGKATIPVEKLPQEMTLLTIRSAEPRHWLQAIDFLASRAKTFPFEEMITASYKLEQVNEALQAMASYQVVKAVINL